MFYLLQRGYDHHFPSSPRDLHAEVSLIIRLGWETELFSELVENASQTTSILRIFQYQS